MKVFTITIGLIILVLFVFLASVDHSGRNDELYSGNLTKTTKMNPQKNKGLRSKNNTHLYQIHKNYFLLYSRLYNTGHLNRILFHNNINSPADFIISNRIDILWGTFNFYSLNYKIPLTKNITLWWQGHIPGLGGDENKFGLTYSNKFNFIIREQKKTTRPAKWP